MFFKHTVIYLWLGERGRPSLAGFSLDEADPDWSKAWYLSVTPAAHDYCCIREIGEERQKKRGLYEDQNVGGWILLKWTLGRIGVVWTDLAQARDPWRVLKTKLNSMVWVREWTIPTERPPLVGEVIANSWGRRVPRGQRDGSLRPYSREHKMMNVLE
jgi:hypothetical protein